MNERIAVVMAGGSGERFWPLSSPDRPKQLLRLTDPSQSMLQEAVQRIRPLVGDHAFISTSGSIRDVVVEAQIVPSDHVLTEPARRNTLGALVWVAANLLAGGLPDATVAVLTADHKIGDQEAFRSTVAAAMDVAENTDGLVTIGINPDRPETGYGYIQVDRSQTIGLPSGRVAFKSRSFHEKPALETAQSFVESGDYLWNAGMFFFRLSTFKSQLALANPEAHDVLLQLSNCLAAQDRLGAVRTFEKLLNVSIDFALMVKADPVYVLPADFTWDDVGAWDALARSLEADSEGNIKQGRVTAIDSSGCILMNDGDERVIGVVGLTDMIVVSTQDAVLVCPKSEAQRVKQIAQQLSIEFPVP